MPVYVYRGRNVRTKESILGERFSNSPQALAALLRREQIAPVAIREKKSKGGACRFAKKFLNPRSRSSPAILRDAECRAPPESRPSMPLPEQHPNAAFRKILEQVRNDVEAGSTLSAAMAHHPKAFDTLYTNMVAAGETGGILDTILQRLTAFIEKS